MFKEIARCSVLSMCLLTSVMLRGQILEEGLTIRFQSIFNGQQISLEEPIKDTLGDSLSLHTLKFYLSNFVFLKKGAVVMQEKNRYHLLDLEDENTLNLKFTGISKMDFDQVQFNLGIDSLTHTSGAMNGDLDPTKGMFWTWQSGYINLKLEGFFEKCPTQNHRFEFHLGGYLAPHQTVQTVRLKVPNGNNFQLQLDLTAFFKQVDWEKKHHVMSPCKEAVAASKTLANSFSIHAK